MAYSWQSGEHTAVIMYFRHKPVGYRLACHVRDELPEGIHIFYRCLAENERVFHAAFFAAARAARSLLRFAIWA